MKKLLLFLLRVVCSIPLALAQITGPSTTASPYVLPLLTGSQFTSMLTVTDDIDGYKMVGIPDGMGAFDNGDETFTLLLNHELTPTAGVVRAHGSTGAFVSKWKIRKSDLAVLEGSDLIQSVYPWDSGTNSFVQSTASFNRFCSGDLPPVTGFFNDWSGMGTWDRMYLNGEEAGPEGRAPLNS
jgi:hypothetical protein